MRDVRETCPRLHGGVHQIRAEAQNIRKGEFTELCHRIRRTPPTTPYHSPRRFFQALYEHQAIRMKIASMARRIECLQSWLDSLVCVCSRAFSSISSEFF